ncbi:MAG: hypothetical protein QME94_16810 [Anaerolineae bacterium]|nr:hypothetical protein [Anaerolineae bacterium]
MPWRIEHLLYRFAAHEEEHVNQIISTRSAASATPTHAQPILTQFLAVRGRLEAALVALGDEQALQSPHEGEWSVVNILRHVLAKWVSASSFDIQVQTDMRGQPRPRGVTGVNAGLVIEPRTPGCPRSQAAPPQRHRARHQRDSMLSL